MGLRWTDTLDIAIELYEAHPDVDPQWIRFTDLQPGCVLCLSLKMIQPSRLKVCLKPFKWHGLTRHAKASS